MSKKINVLITGSAGFIGFHLSKTLTESGYNVVGVDNLNDYYDVNIKLNRLKELGVDAKKGGFICNSKSHKNFSFIKLDIQNKKGLIDLFKKHKFSHVCNLAAQAGVRYSLENPDTYVQSNIQGFLNILEVCREHSVKHLCYASSSSVYGLNDKMPLSTKDAVDHPISLYAASKKSNEMMAHAYSHLFNIPTTGLRFFTVYGPWGRPDMALFKFTKAILNNEAIEIYNNGKLIRDFTYIDDIVDGISRVLFNPPEGVSKESVNLSNSTAPWKIYNIGNSNPVDLMDFIAAIEQKLNKKAIKKFLPMQAGDVIKTYADTNELQKEFSYKPKTNVKKGIDNFINWYINYYEK
jgi:UDP-glucuronate 4-epimerase